MNWTDVTKPPPRRMLRQFAALCLVVFGGLAAWRWANGDTGLATRGLAAAGALVGVIGLIAPAAVRPIYTGWMILAFPIGWTVSRVVLAAVFFLVIAPIAWSFCLIGRDELRLRRQSRGTYWTERPGSRGAASYFRQF
jgi:hypothetical protein